MPDKGLLIVFSGPSGCGKGTLVAKLLAERDDTVLSVSVTTRAPRPGEIDGVHYYFITREQFEKMIADGQLLEYAEYSGNFYGTPKAAVDEHINAGRNVILEIEVQGAMQVMERADDYVSIFLDVPSMEVLEARLRGRGTEEEARIQARMEAAEHEMSLRDRYQYIVMNDEVDLAADKLNQIINLERRNRVC